MSVSDLIAFMFVGMVLLVVLGGGGFVLLVGVASTHTRRHAPNQPDGSGS